MFDKYGVVLPFSKSESEKAPKVNIAEEECINIEKVNNRYFFVQSKNASNYFHFFAQTMSSLYLLYNEYGLNNNIFVFYSLSSWQKEFINTFGIPSSHIIEISKKDKYFFKEVYLCSLSLQHASLDVRQGWFKIDPSNYDYRFELISRANDAKIDIKYDKIYLSRGSLKKRAIKNSIEIEKLMENHGFKIIYSEQYSILEQVNLFHNAKVIIGPTGAAFANLIFCKPETKIGILQQRSLKHQCGGYATMATLLGLKAFVYYEQCVTSEISWSINISSLDSFVLNLLDDNFSNKYDITTLEFEQSFNLQHESSFQNTSVKRRNDLNGKL
jgi:capsular polysaccharide biosynthesis protein